MNIILFVINSTNLFKFFEKKICDVFVCKKHCDIIANLFLNCDDNNCEIFSRKIRCRNRKFRLLRKRAKRVKRFFIFFCKRQISIRKLFNSILFFCEIVSKITKKRKNKQNCFVNKCKIKQIRLKKCDENFKCATI